MDPDPPMPAIETNIIEIYQYDSFTGEETVEIHLHGSKAIIDMTFNALNSFKNIRSRIKYINKR